MRPKEHNTWKESWKLVRLLEIGEECTEARFIVMERHLGEPKAELTRGPCTGWEYWVVYWKRGQRQDLQGLENHQYTVKVIGFLQRRDLDDLIYIPERSPWLLIDWGIWSWKDPVEQLCGNTGVHRWSDTEASEMRKSKLTQRMSRKGRAVCGVMNRRYTNKLLLQIMEERLKERLILFTRITSLTHEPTADLA